MVYNQSFNKKYDFPNKAAKYAFLRTKWPLHKHRILAYMTYRRIESNLLLEEFTTSIDIAYELGISKERASQDLKYLVDRGHMTRDTRKIPYLYKLTRGGEDYGETIWIKWDHYKLDLTRYVNKLMYVFDYKHPYSAKLFDIEKKNLFQRYSKLLEAKDNFLFGKKNHIESEKDRLKETPPPLYLVDEFIERALMMKETYNWNDEEFYRYLVLVNLSIKGDPDQQ